LEVFLAAHQPYAGELPADRTPTDEELVHALTRKGRPVWTEDDFHQLLYTLGCGQKECAVSWRRSRPRINKWKVGYSLDSGTTRCSMSGEWKITRRN
jgi:hypothetical protein